VLLMTSFTLFTQSGASRPFSASVQTLQDQYNIRSFVEVLKEEQWKEAVAMPFR
jgi:hypothetical protein